MSGMAITYVPYETGALNQQTYIEEGSTALRPKRLILKRKLPVGKVPVLEVSALVSHATSATEAGTLMLPAKVSFQFIGRLPVEGWSGDADIAFERFLDYVNSGSCREELIAASLLTITKSLV